MLQTPRFSAASVLASLVGLACLAPAARAWDAHGHRVITFLALDGLPITDKPARAAQPGAGDAAPPAGISLPLWMTAPEFRDACAYQSAEPDRIRAQPTPSLVHLNGPDHYLDLDMLPRWGMTIDTMPTLRHRFIKEMSLARAKFPERFADYDEKKDAANEYEWPGLGAQAMMESYGHLQASFRTLKIIEIVGAQGREAQIAQGQQNVIYHIGRLSHFVGDHAQPLHTTIHHHGWVRDVMKFPDPATDPKVWNPNDYTTDYGFHSYIDGTILVHHGLTYESMMPGQAAVPRRTINELDPWKDVLEHVKRSFAEVEPLYRMHQDDTLRGPEGKAFIEERLRDGADMLRAMIVGAWLSSDPVKRDMDFFINGTPPAGEPSLPRMGDRPLPSKTATEHAQRQAARDAERKRRESEEKKPESTGGNE